MNKKMKKFDTRLCYTIYAKNYESAEKKLVNMFKKKYRDKYNKTLITHMERDLDDFENGVIIK